MCKMVSKDIVKDSASMSLFYERKQHLHPKVWHRRSFCCSTGPVCAEPRHWDWSGPRYNPNGAGQATNLQSKPPSKQAFLDLYLRFTPSCHLSLSQPGATLDALASQKWYFVPFQKPHVALTVLLFLQVNTLQEI